MFDILGLLSNLFAAGATIGVIFAAAARVIPNEKLYSFGVRIGNKANSMGTSKMGSVAWEKTEDFLINSLGEFFKGVKYGLDNEYKDGPNDGDKDVRI